MATKIQIRRGTAAQWTSANPTLSEGEIGVEMDTLKAKLGDGLTAWNSLAYFIGNSSFSLANGSGTTANGNAVDLGGEITQETVIETSEQDLFLGKTSANKGFYIANADQYIGMLGGSTGGQAIYINDDDDNIIVLDGRADETARGLEIDLGGTTGAGYVDGTLPHRLYNDGRYAPISVVSSKQDILNSAAALTDASSIDLTAIKHTLSSSSATRTFTISYTGDDITLVVTLAATGAVYTFPATALCVAEGVASGDNTLTLAGVSGDKYVIGIKKIGSDYYVVSKNFGQ